MGNRRSLGLVLGAGVLAAGLAGSPLAARVSLAGYTVCRTDPVVTLSNGDVVTMYADINADPSQVQSVQYTLQVPRDASVQRVQYDQYRALEHLTITPAANNGRHYRLEADVKTKMPKVPVTVHLDVSGRKSSNQTGQSNTIVAVDM